MFLKTICGIDFVFNIEYIGRTINRYWNDNIYRDTYQITVGANNNLIYFRFYDSIYNTQNKIKLTKDRINEAFNSFLADAISYEQTRTYDNFILEFKYIGYEYDDFNSRQIFYACKQAYEKCLKLMTKEKMYEIVQSI